MPATRCPMRKPTFAIAAHGAFLAAFLAPFLAALFGSVGEAAAQAFPSRPVTMIVPLAIGGSTDVIARIVAEGMRSTLGQPVVVENVTGAGGTIGVGRV